jgi:hypothetical protein
MACEIVAVTVKLTKWRGCGFAVEGSGAVWL